jgi:hypothetical protein
VHVPCLHVRCIFVALLACFTRKGCTLLVVDAVVYCLLDYLILFTCLCVSRALALWLGMHHAVVLLGKYVLHKWIP